MRLLSSSNAVKEMTIENGPVIKRQKDATFHVDDQIGRMMKKSSEWAVVGTNLRTAQGYTCQSCGFVAVFKDHCGKCGGTNLLAE